MRITIWPSVIALGFIVGAWGGQLQAQTVSRQKLLQAYNSLAKPSQGSNARSSRFKGVDAGDSTKVHGGIKVWAERVENGKPTGRFINLAKHKWQRKERFYLWFESCAPVAVSLYQVYPEAGNPGTSQQRLVLPDDKFPRSYETVPAGSRQRFPVMLEMDDNLVDETMAIAVKLVDLPLNSSNQVGDPSIDNVSGFEPVTDDTNNGLASNNLGASIRSKRKEYFQGVAKRAYGDKKVWTRTRFKAAMAVEQDCPEYSQDPDDVCVVALNPFHVGLLEITLHKD